MTVSWSRVSCRIWEGTSKGRWRRGGEYFTCAHLNHSEGLRLTQWKATPPLSQASNLIMVAIWKGKSVVILTRNWKDDENEEGSLGSRWETMKALNVAITTGKERVRYKGFRTTRIGWLTERVRWGGERVMDDTQESDLNCWIEGRNSHWERNRTSVRAGESETQKRCWLLQVRKCWANERRKQTHWESAEFFKVHLGWNTGEHKIGSIIEGRWNNERDWEGQMRITTDIFHKSQEKNNFWGGVNWVKFQKKWNVLWV